MQAWQEGSRAGCRARRGGTAFPKSTRSARLSTHLSDHRGHQDGDDQLCQQVGDVHLPVQGRKAPGLERAGREPMRRNGSQPAGACTHMAACSPRGICWRRKLRLQKAA